MSETIRARTAKPGSNSNVVTGLEDLPIGHLGHTTGA
jgi:hypothetical protein